MKRKPHTITDDDPQIVIDGRLFIFWPVGRTKWEGRFQDAPDEYAAPTRTELLRAAQRREPIPAQAALPL